MKGGRGEGMARSEATWEEKEKRSNVLYHHYIRSRDSETHWEKKSQFLGHSKSVVIVRSDTHHIEGVRKDFCSLHFGEWREKYISPLPFLLASARIFDSCVIHFHAFRLRETERGELGKN